MPAAPSVPPSTSFTMEDLAAKVRRIELGARRMANDAMSGEYHSVFKGRGMEFAEVRPYAIGDDVRTIDWNVTARTGFPHIKRFVEERELTVILAVDASGSLDFGGSAQFKRDLATEICALLALSATRNNDRVGLLLFTDEVELYVPPKKGRKHILRIIRELIAFQPKRRGTNIAGALETLRQLLHRRAVVFLVSDFLENGLERPLSGFSGRHDLVAISVIDQREETLPNLGLCQFVDPETGQTILLDTGSAAVRRQFAHNAAMRRQGRQQLLRKLDVDFVELATDKDYLPPLIRLFHDRAHRH